VGRAEEELEAALVAALRPRIFLKRQQQ